MLTSRPSRLALGIALAALLCLTNTANALITGGEGNTPLENRLD